VIQGIVQSYRLQTSNSRRFLAEGQSSNRNDALKIESKCMEFPLSRYVTLVACRVLGTNRLISCDAYPHAESPKRHAGTNLGRL
jgi:hypothetical protein